MKTYELAYIITPEITSEEAEAKARELETVVQSKEGVILKQTNPVAKTLAFPIKKRASGFFGVIEFQLEPEKLSEVKETVSKDGNIVRHMITIKELLKHRKERRTRIKPAPAFQIEQKTDAAAKEEPSFAKASEGKEKVELKDIEQKLDEILGE
jgi:small subunit ribosomal protein S6